jgi:DNA recombination protein RmuC
MPIFAFMEILYAVAGLLAGFILGGWVASRRAGTSPATPDAGVITELRNQIEQTNVLLAQASEREKSLIGERSTALAEKESFQLQLIQVQEKHQDLENRNERLNRDQVRLSSELAKAQADQDAATRLLADQRTVHEKALTDLREAFKALSADALKQSAPEFMRMAADQFAKLQEASKGDLSQRQEAIAGLLKPLEEQLKNYQQRLQQSETAQSTTLGEVKKQLESLTSRSDTLAKETEQFRMVLKSNQSRGRWGEETLRRVVESAGMSPFCDFIEQVTEDDTRPDMIIRLPGERVIIVDSKVPDLEFLANLEAADPDNRKDALKEHSKKLRKTIVDLGRKNYPAKHANSMDYVVLFLPAESLFSSALEGDHDLVITASESKVMLATPASLIGLLRAINLSWDQMKQTQNTGAIRDAAKELYERVLTFTGHFENIRNSLVTANDHMNKAVGSFQSRVRPQGQKLLELGISGSKDLPDIDPIDKDLRLID